MASFRKLFGGGGKGAGGPSSVRRRPGSLVLTPDERVDRLYPRPSRQQRLPIEWARELVGPGEVVWEVGADAGVFSFCAAVLAGPSGLVLAVEESGKRAAALRRGAEQLGAPDARFEVLLTAVGDEVGVAAPGRGTSGQVTLDSLLGRHRSPTVLRVSERAASLSLLAGARRIVRELRPVLLLDVPERLAADVGPMLRSLGYELFDAETNPSDRLKLARTTRHTLAVPKWARSGEQE